MSYSVAISQLIQTHVVTVRDDVELLDWLAPHTTIIREDDREIVWTARRARLFSVDCVEHALHAIADTLDPDAVARIRDGLALARRYVRGHVPEAERWRALDAVSALQRATDARMRPVIAEDADDDAVFAAADAAAADAAAAIAQRRIVQAAACALIDDDELYASSSATWAAWATPDPDAERAWQAERLREYLAHRLSQMPAS